MNAKRTVLKGFVQALASNPNTSACARLSTKARKECKNPQTLDLHRPGKTKT